MRIKEWSERFGFNSFFLTDMQLDESIPGKDEHAKATKGKRILRTKVFDL